jgi:hypothetical protein
MTRGRLDDVLIAAALLAVAGLCLGFRYLPMADLPQHYAMVSILRHHGDPAYGFAQRYAFDFLGRPYALVYWLGAALAFVVPLGAAMRLVVALCTIAPFAGAHALLAATGRARVWLLCAIPLAFGNLWHWGFLNFLLGTGLFLGGLALVVVASRRASTSASAGLGALGVALFFTHFHGLVMLLAYAPLFVWAYREGRLGPRLLARALGPLVPAAIAAAAFVALTWARAEGSWARMSPGLEERVLRFPEWLAAGLADPWPLAFTLGFAAFALAGVVLGGKGAPQPARVLAAGALGLAAQVAMYLLLPLNTATATFVSGRHALLVVLLVLPLLPVLDGPRALGVRVAAGAGCALALLAAALHLRCFDREARDFDGVFSAMQPNRRVAPLVFARASRCAHDATFPYLHFAAYYQAARGGDLARSFAVVWNVPIRYRADYRRYPIREELEWAPHLFSAADLRHFDYLLVRGPGAPSLPPDAGVRQLARSGAWALLENPNADRPELPAP